MLKAWLECEAEGQWAGIGDSLQGDKCRYSGQIWGLVWAAAQDSLHLSMISQLTCCHLALAIFTFLLLSITVNLIANAKWGLVGIHASCIH